jgi:hypothetical protein
MALRRVYYLCNSKRRLLSSNRLRNTHILISSNFATIIDKSHILNANDENHSSPGPNEGPSSTSRASCSSRSNILDGVHEAQASADLTYFNNNKFINSDGDPLSVSPEVIRSIVSGALLKRDNETLHMVIAESDRVGGLDGPILESSIQQCLEAKDLDNAVILLNLASSRQFNVSLEICEMVLAQSVNNCRWHLGAVALNYMIEKDYEVRGKTGFYIMGGLMKDTAGVEVALRLIVKINEHQRGDLCALFKWNSVNKFSHSMGGQDQRREDLGREHIERAIESSVKAMENGWYSHNVSKMLVVLAVGAHHNDLAVDYIRRTVEMVKRKVKIRTDGADVDMFAVLDGFVQGLAVANRDRHNYATRGKVDRESPLTSMLLDLTIKNMKAAGFESSHGPLQAMEVMRLYWGLSFRVRMSCFYPENRLGDPEFDPNYEQDSDDPNSNPSCSPSSSGVGRRNSEHSDEEHPYHYVDVEPKAPVTKIMGFISPRRSGDTGSRIARIGEHEAARGDWAMRNSYSELKELIGKPFSLSLPTSLSNPLSHPLTCTLFKPLSRTLSLTLSHR